MLIPGSRAPGEDRGAGDCRIVEPAVGGEERPAVEAVEGLARQDAAEIGRDRAGGHRADHLADAVAGRRAPSQIVLTPGEEVARQSAAIADPAAAQILAVVEG